ncbi:hypothetical protein BRARA_B03613 [Brassica rapa]|uniref:Neprosin PEP catalytic domain-containing protein n=1 Tax=Brassica campestris TaxID=3711 RepID=A0A398AM47_BRACM|nr:hypothetical protein BRARA_B03613 [Brassica rapa]
MRLILIFVIMCGFYNETYGEVSLDIDKKLRTLNKPALETIKSEDGDVIDCIDIYKQHAFDHPALRNHKIQMKPSVEFDAKTTTIPNNGSSKPITSQIWSKSGNCPVGTIPVRRVRREDIMRASSPSRFGRKTHHRYSFLDNALQHKANFNLTAKRLREPRSNNRSEAMIVALGFNYLGAQSDINIWNPPGVQAGDYSSAQISLIGGISNSFESIEAGWMVNPSVFGDSRTRLFTYWTKDAYTKTGCINLLCSGFLQTTTKFALGAAIEPVSRARGDQYYMAFSMYLDPNSGNWWLTCGNNVMGYWPGTLFNGLKHSATAVQWGGEVYSPNGIMKKPHTKTPMGSGNWASSLWSRACFHTNLRIKDFSLQVKYPQYLGEYVDEHNCYSTKLHRDTYKAEPRFYFGGPGENPLCP